MKKTIIGLVLILATATAYAAKPPKNQNSGGVSHLAAIDAEGKHVGVWTNGYFLASIPNHPGIFWLNTDYSDTPNFAQGSLYYELPDCAGTPYGQNRNPGGAEGGDISFIELAPGTVGHDYSYPDPNAAPLTLTIMSYRYWTGYCGNFSARTKDFLVPPIPVDLDIVPPIRMELR